MFHFLQKAEKVFLQLWRNANSFLKNLNQSSAQKNRNDKNKDKSIK